MSTQVPFSPCLRAAYLEQAVWWQDKAAFWKHSLEVADTVVCINDLPAYCSIADRAGSEANATAHKYLMFGLGAVDDTRDPYG